MDSSEDDAGTPSASRRASAREKDVGLAEDVDAARNIQHESSETRVSCRTPAMSEDNFDGDSVPSPSSKETSTEAILDMIDDFIGDPRAARVTPPAVVDRVTTPPVPLTSSYLQQNKQSGEPKEQITVPPRELSPAPIANIVILPAEAECTPQSEILVCVNTSAIGESPQTSSSVQVECNESCSTQPPTISQNVIKEVSTEKSVVAPTSDSVETVQVTLDTSECDSLERTVKCTASSESRDSVTVELAESTSSECSVSESKALSMEQTMSRSPLKRRLIRPAPSDRRPDSTVSSTADSHIDIHTLEDTSDTIAKDVSSSSDAVPIHGVSKPEEISNISEISICKAETSTAPSKKIKLVRPKVAPVMSNSVKSEIQTIAVAIERDQCQSTSSDETILQSSGEVDTSSSVVAQKLKKQDDTHAPDIYIIEQQPVELPEALVGAISNSEAFASNAMEEQGPQRSEIPLAVETSLTNTVVLSDIQSVCETSTEDTFSSNLEKQNTSNVSKEGEKDVPVKSKLLLNVLATETARDATEAQCSSTDLDQPQKSHNKESLSSTLGDHIVSQTPSTNYDQDNQIFQDIVQSNISKTEKKVPPIKINLANIDNSKNTKPPSTVEKSGTVEDESTNCKVDSEQQVPELTNRHSEEAQSFLPKLTIKPLQSVKKSSDLHNIQQAPSETKIINTLVPQPTKKSTESISQPTQPSNEKYLDKQKVTEAVIESISTHDQPDMNISSSQYNPNVSKINTVSIVKSDKLNENIATPIQSESGHHTDISGSSNQIPYVSKINIKPIPKPIEKGNENVSTPIQSESKQDTYISDSSKQILNVSKINSKPKLKPVETKNEISTRQSPVITTKENVDSGTNKQVTNIVKLNIKPIVKPTEMVNESLMKSLQNEEQDIDSNKQIPSVSKINIKPILKPAEKVNEITIKPLEPNSDDSFSSKQISNVSKLNIKPIAKPPEKVKDGVTKVTEPIISCPTDIENMQIQSLTKINIKPIPKPTEKGNESVSRSLRSTDQKNEGHGTKQQSPSDKKINTKSIPKVSKNLNDSVPKLNIKPIVKPPEKINEIHRKSSSSEISESECSENDESTSTSDQGPLIAVPKLTIKLGKPGTESEGKFYTEKSVTKRTVKNIQQSEKDDQDQSKMKLIISQFDDKQQDKIPKITIKNITKSDNQPLSPKLTIKPLKPPESMHKDNEIPKLKISTELISSNVDVKENVHVPKITIKPIIKTDGEGTVKTPKKAMAICDSSDHIPVVAKLNIKPILKPTESGESSENYDEKVPVVSKLNIKPVIKPKDNEVDSSIEDVPKITKLNIKPIKNPEESPSDKKDCDEMNAEMRDSCIPVVAKLNIKPIVKPVEDESLKDSENQSSETGNSSDENADNIPVVKKINIKPIVKPNEAEEPVKPIHSEQSIPVVAKLNIKPIVKPDKPAPASPKKDLLKSSGSAGIPVLPKLNIKPVVKPDDLYSKPQEENVEKSSKPPLLMKINMKNVSESIPGNEHLCNNVAGKAHSPKTTHSPKGAKRSLEKNVELTSKPINVICDEFVKNSESNRNSPSLLQVECSLPLGPSSNTSSVVVPEIIHEAILSSPKEQNKIVTSEHTVSDHSMLEIKMKSDPFGDKIGKKNAVQMFETNEKSPKMTEHYNTNYSKASIMNCTLLKKLLSTTKEIEITPDSKPSNCTPQSEKSEPILSSCKEMKPYEDQSELQKRLSPKPETLNDMQNSSDSVKIRPIEEIHKEVNESITKPLEIITDKIANQSSGQDSPRIILKINKTDQGPSAKIITEDTQKPTVSHLPNDDSNKSEHVPETTTETLSPRKQWMNRKKAAAAQLVATMTMGKRLRSSRIVESAEKPIIKRNKRPSSTESPAPLQQKEPELSIFETKRMKLEQLLSSNKSLTITPVVSKATQKSPNKSSISPNQGGKMSHNHSLLNNDNPQKNGNSKLQNILSNLQAKQMQTLQMNDTSITEKPTQLSTEVESGTSTGSSDVIVEITRVENCQLEVQEMMINENSVCDLTGPDEVSQDPLEVDSMKSTPEVLKEPLNVTIQMTPTPRKRGRPRKLPLPDTSNQLTPVPLPVPLPMPVEERPQRSLRLSREKPAILRKPRGGRGRGRGRGGRRPACPPAPSPEPEPEPKREPEPETVVVVEVEERAPSPIDPTSSRIKLPRMTEALDKSVAGATCTTPLSSRRRSSSSQADLKLFSAAAVVLESQVKGDEFTKTPEVTRPRSGRGSRGGRGRSPRNRGRGRGGGRGAMYMKETMGIYGRVCGPATTTVQLFEEETCMMDDNATPSKPVHLLDEDSQSSVKSSTNDSNKMKKSKFADLFDSNKIWTAADVKEYTWPPPDTPNAESQVMMIQEQVAMFLGVKSFKRRYPELKRRAVGGEEREYVLSKGLVPEALCDLGITAVDASEVLDIMLSDYPHKYEEYRSHQRQRQAAEETIEVKVEDKPIKVEVKSEKTSDKPEPPKVDPEKTRQDMAAAAIASAAEWNARANAWRRPACVDLQSNTIHRRRPAPGAPAVRCEPPAGFYPHALLPGQYQHAYRIYTPDQLRYFPLSTVLAAPPAPPSPAESSSESEGSWGEHSSSSDDEATYQSAKRKKLTRKRSSQQDKEDSNTGGEIVDTCRVCKLRLEANRKHTHERFLVCANCNAKLHPACVNLPADTIRKCRTYAWQCGECKTCGACGRQPEGAPDGMLHCDLCDRGFHLTCVSLAATPSGRWLCVECAICKSCGARDPNGLNPGLGTPGPSTPGPSTPGPSTPGVQSGPGEWHHQTRRGPGGHKVYSHSLCTPCARAYRIGRYCPLCERSFIGPKGTMQLVICKLCDRQLHQGGYCDGRFGLESEMGKQHGPESSWKRTSQVR